MKRRGGAGVSGVLVSARRWCQRGAVGRTMPGTAVQLHPHADSGGVLRDGDEAHIAGDDGGVKLFVDDGIGVFVSLYNLHEHTITQERRCTQPQN